MKRALEVLVAFNDDGELAHGGAEDRLAIEGVRGAVDGILGALAQCGHRAEARAVPIDPRGALDFAAGLDCDVVFNQVESLAGDARGEARFAAALELTGLAFTGNRPRAMTLCLEKPLARAVLAAAGVPIARGAVIAPGDRPRGGPGDDGARALAGLAFPVIVKPAREDASHGIALESVARDERAALERARFVHGRYGEPALVEEYLAGREFNVALLEGPTPEEPRLLPIAEMDFTGFPAGAPRIVTYGAKWIEDSPEWRGTRSIAAELEPALEARIRAAASEAWRALGLSGYARVDLRHAPDPAGGPGRLAVIDVNPNPDLSPDAGFALTAQRAGISHAELVAWILDAARTGRSARA